MLNAKKLVSKGAVNFSNSANYRPDIDGLRAIAVVSVVIYHAFPNLLTGGFIGVDVFFVISGYLISNILFKEFASNSFTFKHFYHRRIQRIFPALIVVFLSCIAAGWAFLLPGEFESLGKHIFASTVFIQNILLASETGYFATGVQSKPLLHLWSLGVEEQFYILFPMLLYLFKSYGRWTFYGLLFITVTSVFLSATSLNHSVDFFLPHIRFWEISFGCLLAYIKLNLNLKINNSPLIERLEKFGPNFLSSIGLGLIIIALFFNDKLQWPGLWAVFPVTGAVLVIAAGKDAFLNRYILSSRPFVYIGLISYPLYLWHWPLISFTHILSAEALSDTLLIALVAMSVVLASLTYFFIESPFRYGFIHIKKQHSFNFLLVAMAVISISGLLIFYTDGVTQRFSGNKFFNINQQQRTLPPHVCVNELARVKGARCVGNEDKTPKYLVIGDSHAQHYLQGLNDLEIKFLIVFKPDCAPLFDAELLIRNKSKSCLPAMTEIVNYAIAKQSADVVLLSARWPMYFWGNSIAVKKKQQTDGNVVYQTNGIDNSQLLREALGVTLEKLAASGKEIILLQDIPELDFHPNSCSSKRLFTIPQFLKSPCVVSRSHFNQRANVPEAMIRELAGKYNNVKVISPSKQLCDNDSCWASQDGQPIYFDSNHLNDFGSRLLINRMASELIK